MAELQWEWTVETNLVGRAKSITNEHWRIDILCDGECTLNGTSYNLKQLVDITHGCTCQAKAACQAAEDALRDVWPKYTEPSSSCNAYDIWYAEDDGREISKTGHMIHKAKFYTLADRKRISEAEAMSRLEKPCRKCKTRDKKIAGLERKIKGIQDAAVTLINYMAGE